MAGGKGKKGAAARKAKGARRVPVRPVPPRPVPPRPVPPRPVPPRPVPPRPVPPRPVPPRPVPPRPVPPRPRALTEEEIRRIVEDAARFIEERKAAHGRALGREVGEYLFVEVYGGDLGWYRERSVDKPLSLGDLSRRTGIPERTLHLWTVAAAVRVLLGQEGVDAELGLNQLYALYGLADRMDAAAAVAEWAIAARATAREIREIVDELGEWVEEGGRPEDLVGMADVVIQPEPEPGPGPRPRKRKHRPTPDEKMVGRLLGVVLGWARAAGGRMSAEKAREIRAMVLRIRARLVAKRAGKTAAGRAAR